MASAGAIKAGEAFVQVAVKGTDKAAQDLARWMQGVNAKLGKIDVSSTITAGATGATAFLGIVKAAQEAAKMIQKAFDYAMKNVAESIERVSNTVKMADRLGVGVEWMSAMRLVAEDSNMTLNEMEQSFAAFQRNMITAGQGLGESKTTMDMLGLDPKALQEMGLPEAIRAVTNSLASVEDPSARAGAAMRIFGEQGRKLLPILMGNTGLMDALTEQASFLGTVYDAEGARGVDELRDSWHKLGRQMEGLWDQFTMKLAPALSFLLDGHIIPLIHVLSDMAGAFDDGGLSAIGMEGVFNVLTYVVKNLSLAFGMFVAEAIRGFGDLTRYAADFLEVYSNISEGVGLGRAKWADQAAEGADRVSSAATDIADNLSKGLKDFDANYAKAQQEWADMVEKERENTVRTVADPIEGAGEAIKELTAAFKGEALGRNASTMQRMQEWHMQNSKDIKDYVAKIAGMIGNSPVVMAVP